MNWKCFFGNHQWVTRKVYPCKAHRSNLFGPAVTNIPAECVFKECPKCGKVECVLSDGYDSTEMDVGFQARAILLNVPSAVNDPFMRKVAAL